MGNSKNAVSGTRETLDGVDWDKLDEIAAPKRPPENAFTVYDFASRYGIARSTAQSKIQVLVAEGKLIKHELGGGGKPNYYSLK